jgi:hypothetical protein
VRAISTSNGLTLATNLRNGVQIGLLDIGLKMMITLELIHYKTMEPILKLEKSTAMRTVVGTPMTSHLELGTILMISVLLEAILLMTLA